MDGQTDVDTDRQTDRVSSSILLTWNFGQRFVVRVKMDSRIALKINFNIYKHICVCVCALCIMCICVYVYCMYYQGILKGEVSLYH
jgi:hypothetical protein